MRTSSSSSPPQHVLTQVDDAQLLSELVGASRRNELPIARILSVVSPFSKNISHNRNPTNTARIVSLFRLSRLGLRPFQGITLSWNGSRICKTIAMLLGFPSLTASYIIQSKRLPCTYLMEIEDNSTPSRQRTLIPQSSGAVRGRRKDKIPQFGQK